MSNSLPPSQRAFSAGERVGRYVVERVVSHGGMGTVYRVHHADLRTVHALKVPHDTVRDARARLMQEGRAQAHLLHPNILRVTDVVELEPGGAIGLIADFVDGEDMEAWLSRGPPLQDRLRVVDAIVDGLAFAHAHGFLHRDLKPANVLIGKDGQVRVADFGLTKVLVAELRETETRTATAMGSLRYSAPEQFANAKTVDERADIWSLGCILYTAACLRPPFEGGTPQEILRRELNGDFLPPRTIAPELPDEVVRAIEGAIVPLPQRRIATVTEFRRILGGDRTDVNGRIAAPDAAPPPSGRPASSETILPSGIADPVPEEPNKPGVTEPRARTPAPLPVSDNRSTLTLSPAAGDPQSQRSATSRVAIVLAALLLMTVAAWAGWGPALRTPEDQLTPAPPPAEGAASEQSDVSATDAAPLPVPTMPGSTGDPVASATAKASPLVAAPAAPAAAASPPVTVPAPTSPTDTRVELVLRGFTSPPDRLTIETNCGSRKIIQGGGTRWETALPECNVGARLTFDGPEGSTTTVVGSIAPNEARFDCLRIGALVNCTSMQ